MRHLLASILIGVLAAALWMHPARAQVTNPVEQELIELEHQWARAVIRRNGNFLRRLYAHEYKYTGTDGTVVGKQADIAEIVSGKVNHRSSKLEDMKVRLYGDVAIVTGLNTLLGRYERKAVGGPYRFTDVWVRRNGRWQVVTSHASLATQLCHVTTTIFDVDAGRSFTVPRYVPC